MFFCIFIFLSLLHNRKIVFYGENGAKKKKQQQRNFRELLKKVLGSGVKSG